MADRYWVGGTGTWTSTTRWSTTSGGASGASVPTAADNVFFDTNSGTAHFVVTVTANATCANMSITPEAIEGFTRFELSGKFTITGTLSTSGTLGNRRVEFRSANYGLQQELSVAAAGSLSDIDFRDVRVTGAAAPLSGTRIGDKGGNLGVTFSAPKTVYWASAAGGNWSSDSWAAVSGGAVGTDNFPLPQDTAVIDNSAPAASATITLNTALELSGIDCTARTTPLTLTNTIAGATIYGSHRMGTGISPNTSATGAMVFRGRGSSTIRCSGVNIWGVTIDTITGTVSLEDALTSNSNAANLTITSGNFVTNNHSVDALGLVSTGSRVRSISLGSSTVTLGVSLFSASFSMESQNLTFDAGTSTISVAPRLSTFNGGGLSYRTVVLGSSTTTGFTPTINGANTFANLEVRAIEDSTLQRVLTLTADQTVTGTLTLGGSTATIRRRLRVQSDTRGVRRKLTVNTLSADNTDFLDIEIAGAAAGSSPVDAGDCGNNVGLNFPAPKTLYWNWTGLGTGTRSPFTDEVWALTSGGLPSLNNYPLPQDTLIVDDASGVTVDGIATDAAEVRVLKTFDCSTRTISVTVSLGTVSFAGDLLLSSAVTFGSGVGGLRFIGPGSQTLSLNGATSSAVFIVAQGSVTLGSALTTTGSLTLSGGTFDAATYDVTATSFSTTSTSTRTLKMGSGLWTLTGTGTVWNISNTATLNFYPNTANILLSNNTTTSRTFTGGGLSYNKLTIGGDTSTSTTTISGGNSFTELASTKTVAHTVALGTTAHTFGKWTITGTAGNAVTVSGAGNHVLMGSATSGIDYLIMGTTSFSATSPGEFYAGANSTGTGAAPIFRTAPPTPRTLYWVGGTGNWGDTARWSLSSGGTGGEAVPTSLDNVIFDAASSASAYTITINVNARCNEMTLGAPASGAASLSGSSSLILHGTSTMDASTITTGYNARLRLSGSTTGKTFTPNPTTWGGSGVGAFAVEGYGAEWTIVGTLQGSTNDSLEAVAGTLNLGSATIALPELLAPGSRQRAINFGSSTVTVDALNFGNSETTAANLTTTPGTATLLWGALISIFYGNGKSFPATTYNRSSTGTAEFYGANTFASLTFPENTSSLGQSQTHTFYADQTITGALTLTAAGFAGARRNFVSDTFGVTRTITCGSVTAGAADTDFRDIAIAGAGAPLTGSLLGDAGGNSGITFSAPKTVYFTGGSNYWGSSNAWSATPGGAAARENIPLPQDTAVFPQTQTALRTNMQYPPDFVAAVDMSAVTTDFELGTPTGCNFCGSLTHSSTARFAGDAHFMGRGNSLSFTPAGWSLNNFDLTNPGGSLTITGSAAVGAGTLSKVRLYAGTLNLGGNTVTCLADSGFEFMDTAYAKEVNFGAGGVLVLDNTSADRRQLDVQGVSPRPTFTGTGTMRLASGNLKTFNGNGCDFSNFVLENTSAGNITITGNNTFKDFVNTYKSTGAVSLILGSTVQRFTQFTGEGEAGRLLTISGTSAAAPATIVLTGSTPADLDYVTLSNVQFYPAEEKWYVGLNSTGVGTLGALYEAAPAPQTGGGAFFLVF